MAEIVTETVTVTVSRLAKNGQVLAPVVTPDHLLLLDGALQEIWEMPEGTVVEVGEIAKAD